MRLSAKFSTQWLASLCITSVAVAASWGFDDATVSVHGKKDGVGAGLKEKLVPNKPLPKPITLGGSDTLKVLLTTKEDKKAKRPHQAFLRLCDPNTLLDTSFPLAVKENGKGKVEISYRDIPTQLLASADPLAASLIIASFGSSEPYQMRAFDLEIEQDPTIAAVQEKPLRYGKLPEIHHIFKPDPRSPPKVITLVFTAAVLVALPVLFTTWLSLGANVNHLSKAFTSSPIPHSIFLLSITAMEGVFFLYYTSWNLFQTLPAAAGIGLVAFLTGSRALTEVQERRLAGLR